MPFAAAINAVNILCTAPVAAANTAAVASMQLEVNSHAGFCCKLKKQGIQLMARSTCHEVGKHLKICCDLLPSSPEGIVCFRSGKTEVLITPKYTHVMFTATPVPKGH